MKTIDKIIEKIRDELEKDKQDDRMIMDNFLNLLFWKDYGSSHVDCKDRGEIFKQIEEATEIEDYGDGEYPRLDTNGILPFVNKIRKQLGLFELTNELFGGGNLMERTPEIEKELILKELAK